MTGQECCIAGAGPAGLMLGLLLARAGVKTTVIEKQAGPRCGFRNDTIHPATLEVIEQLGLLDDLLSIPHRRALNYHAEIGGKRRMIANFSRLAAHCKYVAFMSPGDFLDFLIRKANEYPNFKLVSGCEVVALIERGGRVAGVVTRDNEGNEKHFNAALVVGADGRSSTIRKAAKLYAQIVGPAADVLWTSVSRRDGDVVQPVDYAFPNQNTVMIYSSDRWQIAYIIPQGSFRQTKLDGIAALRARLAATVPLPAERFDELTDWDQVHLIKARFDQLRQWWKPGLLCIGDAAHTMSPIGGAGMLLAIQDAVAAANILAAPLRENRLSSAHLNAVQKRRRFPTMVSQKIQILMCSHQTSHGETPGQQTFTLRLMSSSSIMQYIAGRLIGMGIRPERVVGQEAETPETNNRAK